MLLKASGARGVALDMVERLVEYPTVTVKILADLTGVTVPAANNAVARLEQFGVIEQVSPGNYSRLFQAGEVVDILFRPARLDHR